MKIRTVLAVTFFFIFLGAVALIASCSNPDERPMDTVFPMLPHPLAKSPVGLIITDPVFRQREPDPWIEEAYESAAITPMTSADLWNYFNSATSVVNIVGTRITNPKMVTCLVGLATKGVLVNIVVEQGYIEESESAPFITQLQQTGRVTIKTDKDGIARQVHSHYAIIDNHIVLASSGDFLDNSFNLSINNTLVLQAAGTYVNGSGPAGVKTIVDAFMFDFDQMFNMGKFGGDKDRLINHTFNVGVPVEVYFGPNDNLLAEIADEVNNMNSTLTFMINQVSDSDILAILANFGMMGFYDLPSSGNLSQILPLATPFAWSGYNSLNHKVMIIDMPVNFEDALSPVVLEFLDPVVISGSCNWTYAGLKLNDEHLLIVHDQTLGYELGYVEMGVINLAAQNAGVLFGRVRTMRNQPVEEAVVSADVERIIGTPFVGDGGDHPEAETDERGVYAMAVPTGFLRNIHLESLGEAEGGYLYPSVIWGEDQPNQGYNILPGASFEANFYLSPIPTNTGTGTGGGGGGGGFGG